MVVDRFKSNLFIYVYSCESRNASVFHDRKWTLSQEYVFQLGPAYSKLFRYFSGLNYKPAVIKLRLRFYVLILTSQNFASAAAGWDPVPNFNVEQVTVLQGTGQTSVSSRSLFHVV